MAVSDVASNSFGDFMFSTVADGSFHPWKQISGEYNNYGLTTL